MPATFNLNIQGPPPGGATTGADQWISLGVIPAGSKIWIGSARYTSPDKSITFELRTNTAGNSVGSDAQTTLLDAGAVAPRNGTVTRDLWRKGRLHIATVLGSGTEKWWLRLKSKSGAAGGYLYSLAYTTE